jgi:hydroxyacylglutathione hydrolase
MTQFDIEIFPCLSDNFGVILHDPATGQTATIDAPEEQPILNALARRGWTLTHILTTHHHPDHVQGNLGLKDRFGLQIFGPKGEADRIPGIDLSLGDGAEFVFAGHRVEVIETPGHTAGHICYHFPDDHLLFAGDTLFAMGCGRLFEAPASVMWCSFQKLMALPDETTVYFGHEYTLSNARFALTVDPDNDALKTRFQDVTARRTNNQWTIPTTIGLERATNPYMRVDAHSIRKELNMLDAADELVFAEIRSRKDNFKG